MQWVSSLPSRLGGKSKPYSTKNKQPEEEKKNNAVDTSHTTLLWSSLKVSWSSSTASAHRGHHATHPPRASSVHLFLQWLSQGCSQTLGNRQGTPRANSQSVTERDRQPFTLTFTPTGSVAHECAKRAALNERAPFFCWAMSRTDHFSVRRTRALFTRGRMWATKVSRSWIAYTLVSCQLSLILPLCHHLVDVCVAFTDCTECRSGCVL